MCMYANINMGNRAENARGHHEVSVKKYIHMYMWKMMIYISQRESQYVYIFLVSRIYEFCEELFVQQTWDAIREYPDAYDASLPPRRYLKLGNSCPSSAEEWSELRTMNNDRLTDFFSPKTFAAAAAAIALWQLPSDTQGLPPSRPIYKRYVDTPSDRYRYNVLWCIFHIRTCPALKPRRTFSEKQGKTGTATKREIRRNKFNEKKRALAAANTHFLHSPRNIKHSSVKSLRPAKQFRGIILWGSAFSLNLN